MSKSTSFLFAILLTLATVITQAQADEIRLSDGSILMGALVSVSDATAHVDTEFAGSLAIPMSKVTAIRTEKPVMISVETGERLKGNLDISEEGQKVTDTAFGDVSIDLTTVTGVWDIEGTPPMVAEMDAAHQQEVADLKAQLEERNKKLEDLWSGRFEFGFKGETGNKERIDFLGRAEARRKTDIELLTLYIQGKYSQENGSRSNNEIKGGAQIEVDFTERWFAWGSGELEYDEFEDLDLRAIVSAGIGYHFIKEENQTLKGRIGVGYLHESFTDGSSSDDAILEIGYDYMVELNDWLKFTHFFTYYPELSDPLRDYRLEVGAAGEIPLSKDKAWKLKAGVNSDYDSSPKDNVEKLDTYYFMSFVYDWK